MTRAAAMFAIMLCLPSVAAAHPPHNQQTPTPFLPIANEPPPELYVDAPLAEPLARGAVIIPYHTKHFRILPIFGTGATDVSPRAGHLHVSVDGLPWRWADAGDNDTIVVVGLPSGEHKILIELATPVHGVLVGKTVEFVIPTKQEHETARDHHKH